MKQFVEMKTRSQAAVKPSTQKTQIQNEKVDANGKAQATAQKVATKRPDASVSSTKKAGGAGQQWADD